MKINISILGNTVFARIGGSMLVCLVQYPIDKLKEYLAEMGIGVLDDKVKKEAFVRSYKKLREKLDTEIQKRCCDSVYFNGADFVSYDKPFDEIVDHVLTGRSDETKESLIEKLMKRAEDSAHRKLTQDE